ncbi:MAG: transposase [Anaerolineae bacterium]
MTEGASRREYPWREVFNALRCVLSSGIPWRTLPNDFSSSAGCLPAAPTLAEGGCV